jgi:hypothetical protein
VQLSHTATATSAVFDDPNLVIGALLLYVTSSDAHRPITTELPLTVV